MPMQTARPTASLNPITRADFGPDEARHLLWHAGFGGDPFDISTAIDLGPEDAVDRLLDVPGANGVDTSKFRGDIVREWTDAEEEQLRRARQRRNENTLARFREMRQEMQRNDRRQFAELQAWWLEVLATTAHPLQEKMTLFWHGHFATSYRGVENSYHLLLQNQLFREHAVGKFDTLLYGIVRDPAILAYLNNNRSNKREPNENLARELMELFSLGVGNYTERDIKEGARALTGYTFEGNQFVFRDEWHDDNTKNILGVRGPINGDDFVTAILRQPACARFLALKLYRFFVADVSDDPKQIPDNVTLVIGHMASALRRDRYDVKPVLRELFLSEHFYDPANMAGRIKSPVELIAGATRSLDLPVGFHIAMVRMLDAMGQELFRPPSVAGWDGGRSWINTSTIYARQNALALMLAGGRRNPQQRQQFAAGYDPRTVIPNGMTMSGDEFATAMLRHALGPIGDASNPIGAARLESLQEFLETIGPNFGREAAVGVIALITAMPEYQLC